MVLGKQNKTKQLTPQITQVVQWGENGKIIFSPWSLLVFSCNHPASFKSFWDGTTSFLGTMYVKVYGTFCERKANARETWMQNSKFWDCISRKWSLNHLIYIKKPPKPKQQTNSNSKQTKKSQPSQLCISIPLYLADNSYTQVSGMNWILHWIKDQVTIKHLLKLSNFICMFWFFVHIWLF